jgi:hypothetical protein
MKQRSLESAVIDPDYSEMRIYIYISGERGFTIIIEESQYHSQYSVDYRLDDHKVRVQVPVG